MKRAALTMAAVLAAWTLTAATVRTATETFVTNRIAIALQSATNYTDSALASAAGAATNYTDSTAATLRDSIEGKADATNTYTKSEMDAAMNGMQRDIAHYGQLAENAVSSVNGKTGNAVTLDAKDIDILMVRGNTTTNIEYAVNGIDIEMGMTFDAIWRSLSGKQDLLPYATNAIPYAAISGKPTLAAVATSGSYNDLTDKPTIPVVPTNVSAFTNDAGYISSYTETDPVWTAEKGGYATTGALADKADDADVVHTTGNETIMGNKTFYDGIIMENGADIDFSGGRVIIRSTSDSVAVLNHDGIDYSTDGGYNFEHYDWPSASGKIALTAGTGHNGNLAALDAQGNPTDSLIPATNVATKAMIDANNTTFSNAVLSVGLGIDPETIAEINELVDSAHDLPVSGATSVGALLLALAAAAAALKSNKLDSTSAAPAFSTSSTYAVDEHCTYNGKLYRCTTAVTTAGAWDASKWAEDTMTANIPYSLGTPTVINTASSETVEGETVNYGAATLANRTANIVQVTAATALDELRITFPATTSGKVRDFGLRVEIGTGSAALAAPALVPIAPTGETIKIENNAAEIPALADGTATAKGVTLLYFSETAPGVFVVKGEQVEEVA